MRSLKRLVLPALLIIAVSVSAPAPSAAAGGSPTNTAAQVAALQAQVAALQAVVAGLQAANSAHNKNISGLQADVANIKNSSVYALKDYVTVDTSSTIENATGLKGPHIIFSGANVHIVSGSGSTDDGISLGWTPTGLGNLIVGYNEPRLDTSYNPDLTGRDGSHNLIVGRGHKYTSFGGFLAGESNTVSGWGCSVSGGVGNNATGYYCSVSGGTDNTARGESYNSVSGGIGNTAAGNCSSVSGGSHNNTEGDRCSVSGGSYNLAAVEDSSVSGGLYNRVGGWGCSVSGGQYNAVSGAASSVSGGLGITYSVWYGWAAGGTNPNPLNATPPPWYTGSPFLGTYHTP